MKKAKISIDGMHCRSCETLIKDSLEETDGVSKAEVSHRKGIAIVEYDEKRLGLSQIKEIISKEGYKVV